MPKPEQPDPEREARRTHDLLSHVEELHRLCDRRLGRRHPLTRHLYAAMEREDDGDPFDAPKLAQALTAFYGRDEEDQRHVLAGWRPDPDRQSRANAQLMIDSSGPARFLELKSSPNGIGQVTADFTVEFTQGLEVVRLQIREGTGKAEALARIIRLLAIVELYWPVLIDEPDKIGFELPTAINAPAERDREKLGYEA